MPQANEDAKLAELRELAGQRRAAAKDANPGLIEVSQRSRQGVISTTCSLQVKH